MLTLGSLVFAQPWILSALAGLPIIWLLLRVTPPSPRRISFPGIRLLAELRADEETPDTTPWWLLLLRMLFLAAVIIALSQPLVDPNRDLPGEGTLVLVIDDGWAAARDWPTRVERIERLLSEAERDDRPVVLVTTADRAAGETGAVGPIPVAEARKLVAALEPKPWPTNRTKTMADLMALEIEAPAHAVWLTDGIAGATDREFGEALQRLGSLTEVRSDDLGTLVLRPPANEGRVFQIEVVRPVKGPEQHIWVRASDHGGRVLARAEAVFKEGATQAETEISLPVELRNDITRLSIEGEVTVAATVLLDNRFLRRPVGLVSQTDFQGAQPLLDELHYIDRALGPFAEVRRGNVDTLLRGETAVIVMPDTGVLPHEQITALDAWIRRGGVLLRFAGPRLAAASLEGNGLGPEDMVPVFLRRGERALGGALSWAKPLPLAAFPSNSPFVDMEPPSDVRVSRQVLAEPTIDLGDRTRARLSDGTPLVTAERRGEGWLALVHTTANGNWTTLPLSGLFVNMLRRVVGLGTGLGRVKTTTALAPLETLDGFAKLGPPPASARALDADGEVSGPGPSRPPGYYGVELARRAFNLAPTLGEPVVLGPPPEGTVQRGYGLDAELDLMPWLLVSAMVLALLDLIATLVLRGHGLRLSRKASVAGAALIIVVLAGLVPVSVLAQSRGGDPEGFALNATLNTRLAYVLTGDPGVDETSREGLESLSQVLTERTAIEPDSPMAVDIRSDELAFFAILYWPITATQADLSETEIRRLNAYMRNGGTILFDTRDQYEIGLGAGGGGSGLARLRQISRDLDIPPLQPVPVEHVMTKAFYLLKEFPGRYTGGQVWVAAGEGTSDGEVSQIIIGAHDWAAAWARSSDGLYRFPVIPGGELQREMAFRVGVNLVMYALTGNYKADQVHVPAILERLGH